MVNPNIPESTHKRIVIIGAGFGGLTLATQLSRKDFQVVIIDRNNFHQFQPLFYQVAMAGLEPSSITFPLRKVFHKIPNVVVRVAEVLSIEPENKLVHCDLGAIGYDYLVLAIGATTNFFGMENIVRNTMSMKSISETIYLRNRVLQNIEDAVTVDNEEERKALMTIVVVGSGPTGVEVSGTLAEMKRIILPKDYPDLDLNLMEIILVGSSEHVLEVMSEQASKKGECYLKNWV